MELSVFRRLFIGVLLSITCAGRTAAAPSDAELLAGADQRIEKHRKADTAIVVVDRPAGCSQCEDRRRADAARLSLRL